MWIGIMLTAFSNGFDKKKFLGWLMASIGLFGNGLVVLIDGSLSWFVARGLFLFAISALSFYYFLRTFRIYKETKR